MRTLLILLSTAALSHATPSMQQPGGWTKGIKPNHPAGKFMAKPAPVANIDQSKLEAKLQRSTPLSSSEIGYLAKLRNQYQADPVKFRGTAEEAILKAWKRNYRGSPDSASKDPHVNALWDKIIQGQRPTEQDLKLVGEIRTRIQKNPTVYRGSIEEAISKTVKSPR